MLTEHIQEFCQVSPGPLPRVDLGTRLKEALHEMNRGDHGQLFSSAHILRLTSHVHVRKGTSTGAAARIFDWGGKPVA